MQMSTAMESLEVVRGGHLTSQWLREVGAGLVCFDAVAEFIQRRNGVVLCVDRFAYAANFFFFAIPVRRSREAG